MNNLNILTYEKLYQETPLLLLEQHCILNTFRKYYKMNYQDLVFSVELHIGLIPYPLALDS